MNILKKLLGVSRKTPMLSTQKDSIGTQINFNGDFYYTESRLGRGGANIDMEHGVQYHLSPTVTNQILGEAVLDALSKNRWLPYLEDYSDLDLLPIAQSYHKNWLSDVLARYGYKNKTALYQNMIQCDIHVENNLMTISPLNHDQLECSTGDLRDNLESIIIPADSSPEAVGKAARIALSRCLNPYGEKRNLPKHNFDAYI